MTNTVISVENLTKCYDLGVIGTGTLSRDLNRWWAKLRGQPDPYTRIGQQDHFERAGESIVALDDVSFKVEQGEALGIIGKNGAGKSTLLKILSRVTAPTSGVVKVKGRIGSLLEVGTGFHPELTGRENVYLNGAILGMRKDEVDRKFDEIVDFSGVEKFIDTPVKRYSSGMYVRLAFAVAAHLDPEILVVDEVLAVGDAEFQQKCLGKMGDVAGEGRTVLFVSHNMDAIQNLCNDTIVIENGKIGFIGQSDKSVTYYLDKYSNIKNTYLKGVLYEKRQNNEYQPIYVEKVELLNFNFEPLSSVYTWDPLIFRITYKSESKITNGSCIIDIYDQKRQRLGVFDSGKKIELKNGRNHINCIINQIPFSAGEYFVGVGLAISKVHYLWREKNLATLKILSKDVFNIGRPPTSSRMTVAIPHIWTDNKNNFTIHFGEK